LALLYFLKVIKGQACAPTWQSGDWDRLFFILRL